MEGALLIGAMSLVAGLSLLCLPETRDKKLPQTISEAEAMKRWVITIFSQVYRSSKRFHPWLVDFVLGSNE